MGTSAGRCGRVGVGWGRMCVGRGRAGREMTGTVGHTWRAQEDSQRHLPRFRVRQEQYCVVDNFVRWCEERLPFVVQRMTAAARTCSVSPADSRAAPRPPAKSEGAAVLRERRGEGGRQKDRAHKRLEKGCRAN